MKKIFLFLFWSLVFFSSAAQEKIAKNAVYGEILGNGGLYSINYERAFTPKFLLRVGYASWSSTEIFGESTITTIPVMINTLFGSGNHRIEGGLGFVLGVDKYNGDGSFLSGANSKENIFALTGTAGYRYQKPSGGIIFRAGLTPFVNIGDAEYPDFNISAGGSVGYAF